jgi:hypothetical protein
MNKDFNGGFETDDLTLMFDTIRDVDKAVAIAMDSLLYEENASSFVAWPSGPLAGKQFGAVKTTRQKAWSLYAKVDRASRKCSIALLQLASAVDAFRDAQEAAPQRPPYPPKRKNYTPKKP